MKRSFETFKVWFLTFQTKFFSCSFLILFPSYSGHPSLSNLKPVFYDCLVLLKAKGRELTKKWDWNFQLLCGKILYRLWIKTQPEFLKMSSKCWEIHLRWWEKWIRWILILSPKHVELNVLTKPFSVWSHSCHFSWSNRALKGSRLHYFSFLVPKRKITEEEFMWCQKKKTKQVISKAM